MELVQIEGQLDLSVTIEGRTFTGYSVDAKEGMSTCGAIVAEVRTFEDVDFEPLLESDAVVQITLDGMPVRRFTHRLAEASFIGLKDQSLRYRLELRPAFHFQRLVMNTRKFRDQTTEAIVSKILGEQGIAHRWQNERKCESRPYCVQYRETNLAFISRLLEYEGCYYYFEDDGTMVIGDTSSAEDDIPGIATFELRESEGALAHGSLGVTSFKRGSAVVTGKATVNDYDWKKPSTSILAAASAERDTDLEVYDYPTGYRDPKVGSTLANLRRDAFAAEKQWVSGTSTVPWMMAGKQFLFTHSEALDFSGKYLLVRVRHTFKASVAQETQGSYENEFFAIPAATPWRPLLETPRPVVQGNHTAMVRGPAGEEIHTDKMGRAKVEFHWDREANGLDDSRWIRVLQETSSSMVLARVGWEVGVGYIDGDPDRPIELSRLINGQMMPTYGQPARKNMMSIKTESYPGKNGFNEIRMDDSANAQKMDIHAQNDLANTVENNKTEKIKANHTHFVKQGVDRVVEKNQDVQVGGNEVRDVQADFNENVKQNRTETIGGSETIQLATSGQRSVQGNDKESVGGMRMTTTGIPSVSVPAARDMIKMLVPHSVGSPADAAGGKEVYAKMAVQLAQGADPASLGIPTTTEALDKALKDAIPTADDIKGAAENMLSKGTITRNVRKKLTRTVGAAWLQLAGGSILNSSGQMFNELVGGLKLTLSTEGSITQTATKFLVDTVFGMKMRKSKDDMSMASKKSAVKVVGATTMHSDEMVECRGKEIEIEGQTKVTLRSGALLIEMTPQKTTISGPLKVKSGDSIKIAGSPDELTS